MNGPDINRLDVLVIDSTDTETPVWSREGSQGDLWRLGKVKLNDITDEYSVCLFELPRSSKVASHFSILRLDHSSRCCWSKFSR